MGNNIKECNFRANNFSQLLERETTIQLRECCGIFTVDACCNDLQPQSPIGSTRKHHSIYYDL